MKKDEKTELTKEKIINAAIQEFGTNGYAAFTLNAVCNSYGISKGLLYHNFNGKDELYLICVQKCFSNVMAYMQKQEIQGDLHKYMKLRFRYFAEHPLCARIFFEAILQPPKSLIDPIKELKKEFDSFNHHIYRLALSKLKLREGITEVEAIEYYKMIQEMFNGYFSSPAYLEKDLKAVITDHEGKLAKMLDFMLYGIAERDRLR